MTTPNVTVTSTSEPLVAGIAAQVAQELADPTGSRVLSVTVPVGDLTDQSARDELRRGAEAIVASLPQAAG
jgi:hypothetical protein